MVKRSNNQCSAASFTLQVRLPDERLLPVAVTRKHVKNLNLRVRATGSVALSVPAYTTKTRAQEFLDSRAVWIEERLDQLERTDAERAAREAVDTQDGMLPLWGERVAAARRLELDGPGLRELSPDERRTRIDALYRHEVEAALPGIYEPLEARLAVHATKWQVRTMKTRWGSCTPKTGNIRINGALAAYPPECLEAVVAHELVHLLEPSHNERFHALLDTCCPNNRAAMELLKRPPTC